MNLSALLILTLSSRKRCQYTATFLQPEIAALSIPKHELTDNVLTYCQSFTTLTPCFLSHLVLKVCGVNILSFNLSSTFFCWNAIPSCPKG